MNLFEILDGGLLTTVQDTGRRGYQRYGVPAAGAMDLVALRAANRLVGNPDDCAALEMTLVGPRLRVLAPATLALTGGDLGALLDGAPAPRWESFDVAAGSTLAFAGLRDGVRGYLAAAGGLDVPIVLGSRSTYLRSRLGGLDGRALKAGDLLGVTGDRPVVEATRRRVAEDERPFYGHAHRLRVVLGPQDEAFTPAGVRTFLSSTYTVTPQSDRMGYRLSGPAIEHVAGPDIVSDGSPPGAVQVAGDGMPIVLLADRGTAGGYTKIATVTSSDLPRLAQAAPGDTVRFEAVSVAEAITVLAERERWLDGLRGDTTRGGTERKVAAAAAAVAHVLREMDRDLRP
jgi:antagonist of KipI